MQLLRKTELVPFSDLQGAHDMLDESVVPYYIHTLACKCMQTYGVTSSSNNIMVKN